MILVELSSVPAASLPVQELADHLHLGTGFASDGSQDAVMESYLLAAISTIESRTGQVLLQKSFSLELTAWRQKGRQELPLRPVRNVSSLKVTDRAGSDASYDNTVFDFIPDRISPAIASVLGNFPGIPDGGKVEVFFEAGYGPDWADVPADLGQAVLFLAAYFYENRNITDDQSNGLPKTVLTLLEPYRPIRLSRGL